MAANLISENSWKDVAQKFKIKDKELQQALSFYESKIEENDFDLRLKSLGRISALAGNLKRAKEVALLREVVKHLTDLVAAAETEKSNIYKQKAAAAKTEALNKKRDEAPATAGEEEGEEEAQGDYGELLFKAFQKLKAAKNVAYEFVICEAKPLGLMLAKKITAQHRATLSKVTNSKRFQPVGTCLFQDGKFNFSFVKPVSGMARRLQEAIKAHTGKKLAIRVGTESAEAEEDEQAQKPPAGPPAEASAAAAKAASAEGAGAARQAAHERKSLEERRAMFKKARSAWVAVKAKAEADLEKVKAGARMEYLDDPQQYPKVQKGCEDIDAILDHLDDELRDTLDQYASTPLGHQTKLHELAKSASEVLDRYLHYVQNDPILKAIDKKEFADVAVHAPIMKALSTLRKALT